MTYTEIPALRGALKQQQHLLGLVLEHLDPDQRTIVLAELQRVHRENAEFSPAEMGMDPHEDGVGRWLAEQAMEQIQAAPPAPARKLRGVPLLGSIG